MTPLDWIGPEAVLAVCGHSGSGKTTLLESVIPHLVAGGLSVGVVKHDAHGFQIDRPGKDSDRLFRAGAEVVLRGPGETAVRSRPGPHTGLAAAVWTLLSRHDLVLVEGHKDTPLPKLWLEGREGDAPPAEVEGILAVLPWGDGRGEVLEREIRARLRFSWESRPVVGGLLIGGGSRRMGRPKQMLELGGSSFAERLVRVLGPVVSEVVLLGGGEVPPALRRLRRIPDPPGLSGPIAGLSAALRWAPRCAWLLAACDLPLVTPEALQWLISLRVPGVRAVLPVTAGGRVEPLLALYEPHAAPLVERLVLSGRRAPRHLAGEPGVIQATVPPALEAAWRNVNTPEDLAGLPGN